jgi:hypothetical protein
LVVLSLEFLVSLFTKSTSEKTVEIVRNLHPLPLFSELLADPTRLYTTADTTTEDGTVPPADSASATSPAATVHPLLLADAVTPLVARWFNQSFAVLGNPSHEADLTQLWASLAASGLPTRFATLLVTASASQPLGDIALFLLI